MPDRRPTSQLRSRRAPLRPAPALTLAAALALAACAPGPGFDREAGLAPNAHFGDATMTNTLLASGRIGAVESLQSRFAAEVDETVTFPFDSAALGPRARTTLDAQAAWMRAFPELRFSVFGYADEVGPTPYNVALGERRARAVVAYLATRGVSPARLDALVSFGDTRLAVPVPGPERRNRRAITAVSGFDRRHPTVMNGKYAEVVFRGYVASALPAEAVAVETTAE